MPDNLIQHSDSCFTVKNQNAFNKALYLYFGDDIKYKHSTKSEIRGMVREYPTKYPSTIIISYSHEGRNIFIEFLDPTTFCN